MPGYKCKICSDFKVIRIGWHDAQFAIEKHFEIIHNTKVFPGGVEYIEAKPRKLWKCPKCNKEMGYHLKCYHQVNPKTQCII